MCFDGRLEDLNMDGSLGIDCLGGNDFIWDMLGRF